MDAELPEVDADLAGLLLFDLLLLLFLDWLLLLLPEVEDLPSSANFDFRP
jgi:hypothetical protein